MRREETYAFCTSEGTIYINVDVFKSEIEKKYALIHEMSHAFINKHELVKVDWETNPATGEIKVNKVSIHPLIKMHFDFHKKYVESDFKKLKKWEDEIKAKCMAYLVVNGLSLDDAACQINAIMDYLGALTNNQIGGGHTLEYYEIAKGANNVHEWFANMSALYWNKSLILKEELPDIERLINFSYVDIVNYVKKKKIL